MKTRGAVIRQAPGTYEITDLYIDDPREGELRVRMVASGMCHSDDHVATGDLPMGTYPVAGGHEGAGIVDAIGPGTPGFAVGDKVVFSFVPVCGRCRWCATGHQNLCDLSNTIGNGARPTDPTSFRIHTEDGRPVGQMCGVSSFCEYTTISMYSAVKVPDDTPLEQASLLACCVGTGWGAAVYTGGVRPGDTVVVAGVGGVGANALQGAAHAGAVNVIAVDPVELKRDTAMLFGATHAVEDLKQARRLAKSLTDGQGADVTIVTIGVVKSEHIQQAYATVRKQGTLVLSGAGSTQDVGLAIPFGNLTMTEKTIKGSLFGSMNPTVDIPRMLGMYRQGRLKLDELITRRYSLDEINRGYADMHAGKVTRGVICF
ncbi:NDMA-dependent alcohol dehydrogenase [Streptomyces sp. NPDC102360]|uniref:NDMA-dependent alcohol dehydrogenase n=1 Tax=Streptomyces sp. NPDC102360 TaxID=3366160 RepID=UPI00381EA27C